MSFSFRNLFNQEGELPLDEAASANIKISNQSESPFSADRSSDSATGAGRDTVQASVPAAANSLSYTVGELLAFIPPAISAQSGVSTTQIVTVPAPQNGAHEIKLSTLYQVCPNLFAAEITPLNDSVIPLPSPQEKGDIKELDAPSSSPSPTENPFWSASEEASPLDQELPKPSPSLPGDSFSGQGATAPAMDGFSPPASTDPAEAPIQPGLGESLIGIGQDQAAFQEVPQKESTPFAAAETPRPEEKSPALSQSDETTGFISKENPFLSESETPSENDVPNPFDSGPDFSTLFSKEAESDANTPAPEKRNIPVKNAKGEVSQFSAHISPAKPAQPSPPEEPAVAGDSIFGKPSPLDSPASESVDSNGDEEDDLSAFIPPLAEELTIPDIPALRESEEKPQQSETAGMEEYIFQNGAAAAPPAAAKGFVDAISEIPPLGTDSQPEAPLPLKSPIGSQFSGNPLSHPSENSLPGQPLEEETPVVPQPSPVPDAEQFPPIKDEIVRDIELRAVFGTNESFTLRKIATLIACMPGVNACAIATPGLALQASRDEEATIGEEAATLATTVRELAKLTGSPDARSFTIGTDKGVLSIFVHEESYLTVQHNPGEFEPGVQEKLILVSRSLDGIEE